MSTVGSLVAAGRTSDVYEYGSGVVVKVPKPNVPGHWAAKEARFTAAVRQLGAPAPAVVDVIEIDGRDAIVFERIDGRSMWELILENPREVDAWGSELAAIHRRIVRAGLPDRVGGLVERLRSKIDAAVLLTDPERTEALRALERLPRGAALLHGDLHPGNVLMSSTGPFVIDWFDTSVGHPVADVVRTSVLIRPLEAPAQRPHLPGADQSLLQALHEAYVAAMRDVLTRPFDELREWEAVVAASRLSEGAEDDESPLLAIWRERRSGWRSPLANVLSVDQRSK